MKKPLRKMTFIIATLLSLLFFAIAPANAAPHPGATSSLVAPRLGVFRSPLGFEIASGSSGWSQIPAPSDNKYVAAVYKPRASEAKGESPMLTVRIDTLNKDTTLDAYVRRWSKEYPKFGFDVLGSQPFTQNNERGYVLDLINRDSNRQLRQVVFIKKKKAVILTCRDQSASFKDTLRSCNEIIRTFRWTLPSGASAT